MELSAEAGGTAGSVARSPTSSFSGAGADSTSSSSQASVAATVAGMKMEFPAPLPVYGHGFGPPPTLALALDLSATKVENPVSSAFIPVTTVDNGEGSMNESTLLATVRIKREVKTEEDHHPLAPTTTDEEDDDDDAVGGEEETEGCSRTLPRMPEAWRRQRQEHQLQVIQTSSQSQAASKPCGKALIRKRSPSSSSAAASSSSSSIPVGIAVARQRGSDKSRRRSDTPPEPKQRRTTGGIISKYPPDRTHIPSQPLPSSHPPASNNLSTDLFIGGSPLPPPLPPSAGMNFFSSAASALYAAGHTTNWAWPTHHPSGLDPAMHLQQFNPTASLPHSYWPPPPPPPPTVDHHHVMSYSSGYPANHAHATPTHHHHSPSGLSPSPFLLIPAACLDPYQRAAAAMLWPAGYGNPSQAPWGLATESHPPTPLSPWSMTRSAFELPTLRPEVSPAPPAATPSSADTDDVKPPPLVLDVCQLRNIREDPVGIKEERRSPSIPDSPRSGTLCYSSDGESLDLVTVDPPPVVVIKQSLSPDPPSNVPTTQPLEFSGLHLLSDVSTADRARRESQDDLASSRRSSLEATSTSSLDVLCAAALSQEQQQQQVEEKTVPATVSSARSSVDDVIVTPVTSSSSSAATTSPANAPPHAFQMAEFDFRSKLAELQRKYKERQKELNNLSCKRKDGKSESKSSKEKRNKEKKRRRSSAEEAKNKKTKRRDSSSSSSRDGGTPRHPSSSASSNASGTINIPPSKLSMEGKTSNGGDFISPGRLDLQRPTQGEDEDELTKEVVEPRIPVSYAVALASAAVSSSSTTTPTSSPLPSNTTGEKKKRKPDFPIRKPDAELTSETIVPLSKKRKLFQLFQWCHSTNSNVPDPSRSTTTKKRKKSNDNNNISKKMQDTTSCDKPKIKPKLKAEVQVKRITSSSSSASSGDEEDDEELVLDPNVVPEEETAGSRIKENESQRLERQCLPALQFLQLSDDSGAEVDVLPSPSPVAHIAPAPPTPPPILDDVEPYNDGDSVVLDNTPWLLSQELLKDGLRVLIAEDGLFLGGSVTGIRPPDIYGVLVDGERCSRPRILSTEELLNDALLEVKPVEGLKQLPIGTRVCAYWSPKSRCLYPGVVSNIYPAAPPTSHRGVAREDEIGVEFDDGDSGRIPISQIRVLPPDYPISEVEPNPLDTIESRRKKRISSEPIPVASVKPSINRADSAPEEEGSQTEVGTDNKNSKKNKKHKKKHKKHRKSVTPTTSEPQDQGIEQHDLIIPISPGLTPEDEEPGNKMETRNGRESVNSPESPSRVNPEPQRKTNKSKMAAFLPERQLWQWMGTSFKKSSKGKGRKEFYKAIHRGNEIIRVGDCAVFLSVGRPDRPYVGRIELLWQSWGGSMTVKVRWFYHPEETCGGRRLANLKVPGALFESNHADENDVQTISHCCSVTSLDEYRSSLGSNKPDVNLNLGADETVTSTNYDNFYLAGFYDPTSGHLSFEPGVLDQS